MTELKYKYITEKIIGASFEVHKFPGNGFQEVIYQRPLEEKILVEIKAIIQLEDVHLAQILNSLKAYKLEVGLLINLEAKA